MSGRLHSSCITNDSTLRMTSYFTFTRAIVNFILAQRLNETYGKVDSHFTLFDFLHLYCIEKCSHKIFVSNNLFIFFCILQFEIPLLKKVNSFTSDITSQKTVHSLKTIVFFLPYVRNLKSS